MTVGSWPLKQLSPQTEALPGASSMPPPDPPAALLPNSLPPKRPERGSIPGARSHPCA